MPNFYTTEQAPRPKQEGFKPEKGKHPIEDFTAAEAVEYGELMKSTFIGHWEQKTGEVVEQNVKQPREKIIAENLWGVIEDVETLADEMKPAKAKDYKVFYEAVMNIQKRRHQFGTVVNGVVIFNPF